MKRYPYIYYIIYLLTILDIAFTATGLKLGVIEEGNPIMNYFIESSIELTTFCVLAYVGIALVFIYKASPKIRWLNTALAGLSSVKVYIVVLHLRWISMYFAGNV